MIRSERRQMVLYLSGRYSGTPEEVKANIALARKYAIKFWEYGYTVLCPHLNTSFFENDCKIEYDDYIAGDLRLIDGCDAVLMLPGWRDSKGAKIELEHARKRSIPAMDISNIETYLPYTTLDQVLDSIIDVYRQENSEKKQQDESGGKKYDSDKPRWDLVDYPQIEKLSKILTMGAKKYADNNWQQVEPFKSRYFAAVMRHLAAWKSGELKDAESGQSHLDHAFCNIMFLMWGEDHGK